MKLPATLREALERTGRLTSVTSFYREAKHLRMPEIDYRVDRAVAVISFANPPVNGLSHGVRVGISTTLERAQADPSVRAIILTGAGGLFSGGADIREFGTPASMTDPTLRQLIELVETSAKPVIAAIAGACLGGGLELALAAHYRVASAEAKLGLPEVKLGLLPGAGGTQRLPRLVGVDKAIDMIVGGEPVPAARLANTALLDRVVNSDALAGQLSSRLQPKSRRDRLPELATSRSTNRTSQPCARPLAPGSGRSGPCCRLPCARWTRSKRRANPSMKDSRSSGAPSSS